MNFGIANPKLLTNLPGQKIVTTLMSAAAVECNSDAIKHTKMPLLLKK